MPNDEQRLRSRCRDAEVATTQQRHRPRDAPRHQVAVRVLSVGEPELAAEVPGRHVRAAGEGLECRAAARTPGRSGRARGVAVRGREGAATRRVWRSFARSWHSASTRRSSADVGALHSIDRNPPTSGVSRNREDVLVGSEDHVGRAPAWRDRKPRRCRWIWMHIDAPSHRSLGERPPLSFLSGSRVRAQGAHLCEPTELDQSRRGRSMSALVERSAE